MSHVKFVQWVARMPNSDRLCNSFRAAGTNGRLDFSLSLLAARGSVSCPRKMWPGSKELQLAKESVTPWLRSSTGWMPVRTGRLSVGVGRRHSVTMRKASLRTLSMRRVCALRHQAGVVSALFSFTPGSVGTGQNGKILPLFLTFSSCLASQLWR